MSGNDWDRAWQGGGPAAERPDAWLVDREHLWGWIEDALRGIPFPLVGLDADALRALCAQALDTRAPAVLVHAQAAGVLLERLVAAALARAYVDRHGHPDDLYEVAPLRDTVRGLRRDAALVGSQPGSGRA